MVGSLLLVVCVGAGWLLVLVFLVVGVDAFWVLGVGLVGGCGLGSFLLRCLVGLGLVVLVRICLRVVRMRIA